MFQTLSAEHFLGRTQPNALPREGDDYGVIYKGSFILPLLGLVMAGILILLVIRRRRR